MPFLISLVCCFAAALPNSCSLLGQDVNQTIREFLPAEVFPGTTAAYIELRDPTAFLQTLFEHPIADRLQQTEAWKQALRSLA